MAVFKNRGFLVIVALAIVCSAGAADAQNSSETPYAASRLIGRWRTVMNRTLEDTRAFAAEEVTDLMEEFVSPGAVRAVQDKATEAQLKKADEAVEQFVYAMVKVSKRQPDGSVVVDASAIEPARKAICPVYPFCDR
jgi:predicted component of type VI protein secretion system